MAIDRIFLVFANDDMTSKMIHNLENTEQFSRKLLDRKVQNQNKLTAVSPMYADERNGNSKIALTEIALWINAMARAFELNAHEVV
jgi:hypothetical protein